MGPNEFDIRVREVKVLHVDLKPLTKLILEEAKGSLDKVLLGACTYRYIGKESDGSQAIRVTVSMAAILPAFPKMSLTGIDVKDHELRMKAARDRKSTRLNSS